MAVGPAKRDTQAALLEAFGHGLGVLDGLLLEFLELFGAGQFEGKRQGCEDMNVRAALFPGENGLVELLRQGRVSGQDDRPARPVQGLVGGGGDDMSITDR